MKVVHFSLTVLAGVPLRNSDALNKYTDYESRVVYYTSNPYGNDLIWKKDDHKEEAVRVAEEADIIHLYNLLDLDSSHFSPINFRKLKERGKLVCLHMYTNIDRIIGFKGITEKEFLEMDIPMMSACHLQSPSYPNARLVPNMIDASDPKYAPGEYDGTDIVFSPSNKTSCWDVYGHSKGYPEIKPILERLTEATHKIFYERFHEAVLDGKRNCLVVIDDLVHGAFHTSAQEGLAMARAVLCHVDPWYDFVTRTVSGSDYLPFVDCRLEELELTLKHLLKHRDETIQIGKESREWMMKYYTAEKLVWRLVDAYKELEQTGTLERQPELSYDTQTKRLNALVMPRLRWAARKRAWDPPAAEG